MNISLLLSPCIRRLFGTFNSFIFLEIHPSSKWQEIQEREMEEQKLKEMQEVELRDRIDRRLQYAKDIKKEHWPTVSIRKRQEIEKRKLILGG